MTTTATTTTEMTVLTFYFYSKVVIVFKPAHTTVQQLPTLDRCMWLCGMQECLLRRQFLKTINADLSALNDTQKNMVYWKTVGWTQGILLNILSNNINKNFEGSGTRDCHEAAGYVHLNTIRLM